MGKTLQFASSWKTGQEARDFWNGRARQYNQRAWQSSSTKEALVNHYVALGVLNQNTRVLDLGCGPGNYTKLLAPHVKEVVAVDISDEMLACARENTKDFSNVTLLNLDWWEADVDALGFRGAFDFVFANMTPSVRDEDTFLKMLACSSHFCHFATFVYRHSNLDPLIHPNLAPYQNGRLVFDLLWDRGMYPDVSYGDSREDRELTPEALLELADAELRPELTERMPELLETRAVNGLFPYRYHSRYAHMFWSVLPDPDAPADLT